MINLNEKLKLFTDLTELNISGNTIGEEGIKSLCLIMSNISQLQFINYNNVNVNLENISILCYIIENKVKNNLNCENLDLSNCILWNIIGNIGNLEIFVINDYLKDMTNIKTLNLSSI